MMSCHSNEPTNIQTVKHIAKQNRKDAGQDERKKAREREINTFSVMLEMASPCGYCQFANGTTWSVSCVENQDGLPGNRACKPDRPHNTQHSTVANRQIQ